MSLTPSNSNDHQRRPSGSSGSSTSGFFHSLKKFALGGAKDVAVDPEFDTVRESFQSVFDAGKKVRGGVLAYIAALRSLLSSSGSIANDVADVLELKTAEPHLYSTFVRDARKAHTELVQHKMVAVLSVLETRALKRLDQLIEFGNNVQKRIEERTKMKEEFEYYSKKVAELKKERDKHAASSKKEDPKEIEKYERNTKKLEDIRISYTQANANLLVDMRAVWERRADTFGPAALEFIQGEKDFVHFYGRALDGLGEGMIAPPIATFATTSNAPLSAAAGSVAAKTDTLIHAYAPNDSPLPQPSSSSSSASSTFAQVPGETNEVEINAAAKPRMSSAAPPPPPPPPQPPQPSAAPRPSGADLAAAAASSVSAASSSTSTAQQPPVYRTQSNPFDDVSL